MHVGQDPRPSVLMRLFVFVCLKVIFVEGESGSVQERNNKTEKLPVIKDHFFVLGFS